MANELVSARLGEDDRALLRTLVGCVVDHPESHTNRVMVKWIRGDLVYFVGLHPGAHSWHSRPLKYPTNLGPVLLNLGFATGSEDDFVFTDRAIEWYRSATASSSEGSRPGSHSAFDQTLLEPEQEALLATLVVAARDLPRDRRQKFMLLHARGSPQHSLIHDGFPQSLDVYIGDIEVLANEGLLTLTASGQRGTQLVDVTPKGFAYYQHAKQRSGQPVHEIEVEIGRYLDGQRFRQRHPRAHQKWALAIERLWASDSTAQYTVIGHLCREAMQEFADELVEREQPTLPPQAGRDIQKTVIRVRAIIDQRKDRLGTTVAPFLDALLTYWGTVADLSQRQEHGAHKEGEPLNWGDARRLVFQTAIVMFEIDSTLVGQ